eukprot:c17190_g1_i1 orf=111-314(+)
MPSILCTTSCWIDSSKSQATSCQNAIPSINCCQCHFPWIVVLERMYSHKVCSFHHLFFCEVNSLSSE